MTRLHVTYEDTKTWFDRGPVVHAPALRALIAAIPAAAAATGTMAAIRLPPRVK
jgi:hypothetical protein